MGMYFILWAITQYHLTFCSYFSSPFAWLLSPFDTRLSVWFASMSDHFLISGKVRHSGLSCSFPVRPRASHFSKESWFFFLENGLIN